MPQKIRTTAVSPAAFDPTDRKAVTGVGSAGKEQVQRMTQVLLGMAALPEPEDASDALAVAVFVLGPAEGLKLISQHREMNAIIIDADENLHASPSILERLTGQKPPEPEKKSAKGGRKR